MKDENRNIIPEPGKGTKEFRRFDVKNLELRAETGETNQRKLEGYFALTNSDSVQMYMWHNDEIRRVTERFLPGAFNNSDISDVIYNVEHNNENPIARTGSNLEIIIDQKGLFARATLPNERKSSDYQNNLYKNIEQNIIRSNSFAFTIPEGGDRFYEDENGEVFRDISAVDKIYDITSTVSPAYPETFVQSRSLDSIEKPKPAQPEERNGDTTDIDFEMFLIKQKQI